KTEGLTANATLSVVDEAKATEVTFDGIYNENGKQLTEDTANELNEDFYLLIDAVDQYGDAVNNVEHLVEDLTVLTSNPGIVDVEAIEEIKIGEETKYGIKLNADITGDALITVISNATGESFTETVTVEEGVKVDTVNIGTPEGI